MDSFIGKTDALIEINAGFRNPISNKSVSGFEVRMTDKSNFLVHFKTSNLEIKP